MAKTDHLRNLMEQAKNTVRDYTSRENSIMTNPDFTDKYKAQAVQRIRAQAADEYANHWNTVLAEISQLKANEELSLPLADSSLLNAVTLIQKLGENMSDSVAENISNQFAGRLASQRVLADTFRGIGRTSDALHIENRIYDPDKFYNKLAAELHKTITGGEVTSIDEATLYLDIIDKNIPAPAESVNYAKEIIPEFF